MRKAIRIVGLSLLALVGPVLAQAATYYTAKNGNNNNSCGTASAGQGCTGGTCSKATIQAGIACLHGGDTLLVNSGTYVQDPIFKPPSGSPSQYTSIRSMNGRATTTILANDISGDCLACPSTNDYIEVDGFKLDGNGLTGFVVAGNSDSVGFTLKNSEVTRSRHSGILTDHAVGWRLEGNDIHHNGGNPDKDHGVYFTARDSLIKNNYIHHNACWGMQIQSGENHPPVPQNDKVYGNIFELNGCGGLVSVQGSNHQIVNNIFVNESTMGSPNNSYFMFAVPNGIVYNNTFYCTTMLEIEYGIAGASVANNLFYCPGTTLTIQRRTGGGLRAAYSNNLLNENPNFVNVNAPMSGGFQLQAGSVAIDRVSCRAQASPDKAGGVRPYPAGGLCDYGAYEFGSTPSDAPAPAPAPEPAPAPAPPPVSALPAPRNLRLLPLP